MTSFCRRMRFLARIAAVFLCVPAVFAVVSWATTPQTDASKQAPRRDLTIADLFQIKDVADAQSAIESCN